METGLRSEGLTIWLQRPLYEGSPILLWMAVAAGLFLTLMLILLILRRKRRSRKNKPVQEPVTQRPIPQQSITLPVLEVYNLQGVGSRSEQQDAFVISNLNNYDKDGLLMILCDGMGGMAEGKTIATETASNLLNKFPWKDNSEVLSWIKEWSRQVYRQFRGQGGTTLVAAFVKDQTLNFWCVGDSDLYLLREGALYALHLSQDYRSELVVRSLDGAFPVEEAFLNKQAKALTEYIGKEDVRCASTRIPFKLQPEDTLMLSSDGISDTLSLNQLREAMALGAQMACDRLEEEILLVGNHSQDNYTAIILKYHG